MGEDDSMVSSAHGISVIIPALNEADRIARAIESVSRADEVIVVDGGSQDATQEVASIRLDDIITKQGKDGVCGEQGF